MIGYILSLSLVAFAAGKEAKVFQVYHGVDPNTLSCDPTGMTFLLLPHFTDCNKYYMCAHGQEVEFTCPASTIFDFALQTCNWSWATKCYLRDSDIEGSGFDSNDGVMAFGLFGEEAENGPAVLTGDSSRTVRPVSPVQAQLFKGLLNCQSLSEASKQIAYKGDCQRYWKCVSGAPQAVYCSDGLYFNEEKQQCDYEANAKCVVKNEVDTELDGEFIVYE